MWNGSNDIDCVNLLGCHDGREGGWERWTAFKLPSLPCGAVKALAWGGDAGRQQNTAHNTATNYEHCTRVRISRE